MVGKCTSCGKEFSSRALKKYYSYKLKEYRTGKINYFCSYSCMQKEKRDNPEKYAKER